MFRTLVVLFGLIFLSLGCGPAERSEQSADSSAGQIDSSFTQTHYKTVEVNGVNIFYREAGPEGAPTILLLHGYPTSSHMFRNLIRDLSDQYHLLAPDYPGYGRSEQPPMAEFEYTFDNMAKIVEGFLEVLNVEKFSIYLMDYGAPIGYRIVAKYPERVEALIVQNGNAYEEGLKEFWDPIKKYWNEKTVENGKALEGFHSLDGLKWQYTNGVRDVEKISPDNWHVDLQHLSRPENNDIQLAMFYDYRTNVPLYPGMAGLFPRTSTSHVDRVGKERSYLSGRWGRTLQA